jgi:hypothetical protein
MMENSNEEINRNQTNDLWQAKVHGQIYDTNFVGITGWISEGAIQSSDKVRCGNLHWIEAGKIPAFLPFFNAKGNGLILNNIKISHTHFSNNDQKINSSEPKLYGGLYSFINRIIRRIVSH